jgi:hypothetical protein
MARTHPFAEDDARPKPHASEGVTPTRHTGSPTKQGKVESMTRKSTSEMRRHTASQADTGMIQTNGLIACPC